MRNSCRYASLCDTRDEGERKGSNGEVNPAGAKGEGEKEEKTVYLHASLIYARRPATSDKSLTPRHYLFGCAHWCARARAIFFQTSRENDTFAMNIKRTPTPGRHTDTGRPGRPAALTPRILYEAPVRTQTRVAIVTSTRTIEKT